MRWPFNSLTFPSSFRTQMKYHLPLKCFLSASTRWHSQALVSEEPKFIAWFMTLASGLTCQKSLSLSLLICIPKEASPASPRAVVRFIGLLGACGKEAHKKVCWTGVSFWWALGSSTSDLEWRWLGQGDSYLWSLGKGVSSVHQLWIQNCMVQGAALAQNTRSN